MNKKVTKLWWLYICLLTTMTLFGACKKDAANVVPSIDNKMLNEIRELPTVSAKRIAFSSLLPSEKLALINMQFDYILDKVTLNKAQISLILEMKEALTDDLYSTDSAVKLNYRATTLKKYEQRCLAEFDKNFIITYFGTITNPNSDTMGLTAAAGSSCECSTFSDYCFFSTCKVYNNIDCHATSNDGCGFLWDYPCNGRCKSTQT